MTQLNELSSVLPSLMARALFLYHHYYPQFLIPFKGIHTHGLPQFLRDPVKKLDYVVIVEGL